MVKYFLLLIILIFILNNFCNIKENFQNKINLTIITRDRDEHMKLYIKNIKLT